MLQIQLVVRRSNNNIILISNCSNTNKHNDGNNTNDHSNVQNSYQKQV